MFEYGYWHWRSLRMAVLERDECCVYCSKKLDNRTVTLDHVIPKAKGGSDLLDNLVACCRACNSEKEDKLALNFFVERFHITAT